MHQQHSRNDVVTTFHPVGPITLYVLLYRPTAVDAVAAT